MSVFAGVEQKVAKKLEKEIKRLEEKLESMHRRLCKLEGTPIKKQSTEEKDDACTIT